MARSAGRNSVNKDAQPSGDDLMDSPLLKRDGMISKDELAEFLGIPGGTLDHWASRGGGPVFYGVGNHKKYWPADVRTWLKARRKEVSKDVSGNGQRGAA